MKKLDLNLPTFGFIVATRAVLGMGIGLLLSTRLSPRQRRRLGLGLLATGLATTVPAAWAVFGQRHSNNPTPAV